MIETCPLLNDISWIRHGFYPADNPRSQAKGLTGILPFNNDFPATLFLKQTHTDHFITLPEQSDQEADAAITHDDNLGLAIKTADCCPVLLVCTHSRQIAAVHAGWRGALNQITAKTISGMLEKGAKADHIIAAIGPSIAQKSMPVMDDVYDLFQAHQPDKMGFLKPFEDRWLLDVAGIVRQQLLDKGVNQIWQSSINTFEDLDYFSYRRFTTGISPSFASNISLIIKINP